MRTIVKLVLGKVDVDERRPVESYKQNKKKKDRKKKRVGRSNKRGSETSMCKCKTSGSWLIFWWYQG